MNVVKAKLVTRFFKNGIEAIRSNVPLGKEYLIDLDSKKMAENANLEHNKIFPIEVVRVVTESAAHGWFPLELLEIVD